MGAAKHLNVLFAHPARVHKHLGVIEYLGKAKANGFKVLAVKFRLLTVDGKLGEVKVVVQELVKQIHPQFLAQLVNDPWDVKVQVDEGQLGVGVQEGDGVLGGFKVIPAQHRVARFNVFQFVNEDAHKVRGNRALQFKEGVVDRGVGGHEVPKGAGGVVGAGKVLKEGCMFLVDGGHGRRRVG